MNRIELVTQIAEMNSAFRQYCEADGAEIVATNTDAYYMWINAWAAARDFYLSNKSTQTVS